jgi:ectoine hydroxylase-related dioxygenase (phytanoyl-CoA dioxygenase family)
MSFRDLEDKDRKIGYRIKDPHSHSKIIEHFYLHPEIFRYVELIFGRKAIAFQSIYFEFGSQQGLHRDPMFVVTKPPSHLVASWIALDSITDECGPLRYVPRSHRLPWYEFGPDKITAKGSEVTPADRKNCKETIERLCAEKGLKERTLVVPRGDVLIWHGNLLHGGTPVMNEKATRKSFVVHYSTYGNYKRRRGTMKMNSLIDGEVDTVRVGGTTTRILEQEGCAGLDNPLLYMKKESSGKQALKRIGKKLLRH